MDSVDKTKNFVAAALIFDSTINNKCFDFVMALFCHYIGESLIIKRLAVSINERLLT